MGRATTRVTTRSATQVFTSAAGMPVRIASRSTSGVEPGVGQADGSGDRGGRDQVGDDHGGRNGQPGLGADRVPAREDEVIRHQPQHGLEAEHREVEAQFQSAQTRPQQEREPGAEDVGGHVLLGGQKGQPGDGGDLTQRQGVRAAFGRQMDDEHFDQREQWQQNEPGHGRDRDVRVGQEEGYGDRGRCQGHQRRELPHSALGQGAACSRLCGHLGSAHISSGQAVPTAGYPGAVVPAAGHPGTLVPASGLP